MVVTFKTISNQFDIFYILLYNPTGGDNLFMDMKKCSVLFLLIVLIGGSQQKLFAQDYRFHSVFIYNFTKYIQWPEASNSGDFVIGVLGDSPIISELEKMASTKTAGSQKFVIKKIESVAEVNKMQILFIPNARSKFLEEVIGKVGSQPTLVITEKPGLGQKGSGINFILVDGKWKFELNRAATDKGGLKISGELARLAIEI